MIGCVVKIISKRKTKVCLIYTSKTYPIWPFIIIFNKNWIL